MNQCTEQRTNSQLSDRRLAELAAVARRLRVESLKMIAAAGSGHPGGSLSAAELLACLYFEIMNLDPANPGWPERDRFVLSKGHAAPVLYAALALRGYFPVEWLATLRQLGSPLQGHPHMRTTPGVEVSTGSLGQGLSLACGLALAAKIDGAGWRTYCLVGDGETQEGQIWEAAAAASHYRLGNLTALVDANGLQIDGPCEDVMNVEPLRERWQAFGWQALEVDGHSLPAVLTALRTCQLVRGRPSVVICRTVKGKGVSFMEGKAGWHGKAPSNAELTEALAELELDDQQGGGRA